MFKKLKLNSEGLKVKEAQQLLRKAGSTIKVTGFYSIGMYAAVKAFQKRNGLKVTGEIDAMTWKKLQARRIVKMAPKKK